MKHILFNLITIITLFSNQWSRIRALQLFVTHLPATEVQANKMSLLKKFWKVIKRL